MRSWRDVSPVRDRRVNCRGFMVIGNVRGGHVGK